MAFAGAIVPGVARLIVVLSAHAGVFGVGITAIVGSILVPLSCAMSCGIVPGGGFAGISGVDSGRAAPLVGGPPGTELQTVVEELPSGAVGGMFPVAVVTMGVGIVPNAPDGAIAAGDIVGPVAMVLGIEVDRALMTVDGAGTGTGVMEGDGSGGTAGGGGCGMVVPG